MKKRYIAMGAGILLVVCLAVGIWSFPLVQAAFMLNRVPDFNRFAYEVSLELNEDNLSDEQRQFMNVMSWMLNADKEACFNWKAAGTFQDDSTYAKIYCEGLSDPVTEVYFSEKESVINIKMLYETIRQNVMASHPLVGGVLPEWGYGEYISIEQIEEIFQVDLKEMFRIERPAENRKQGLWQSFCMLGKMDRRKGDNGELQFETSFNTYQVLLEFAEKDEIPVIGISGSDMEETQKIAGYAGKVTFGNPQAITFPDSLMADEDIEQFARLWATLCEMKDKVDKIM